MLDEEHPMPVSPRTPRIDNKILNNAQYVYMQPNFVQCEALYNWQNLE